MFKYSKKLVQIVEENKEAVEKDYQKAYEAVGNSNAVYKGKQLPFLYFPAVYSSEDIKRFEKITEDIFHIVNKSIDIYLKHPHVRPIWDFPKELEALIELEPRFKCNVPMGRFDFFYYPNGDYKFCELNTDGTSAMNEETPLSDVLSSTLVMDAFKKTHTVRRYELYQSWVDEVKALYDKFVENGGRRSQTPMVAIMDFMSKGSPHEFKAFQSVFIENGFRCKIISPDAISEEGGHLYYENEKIDIIYRRLVTRDMMDHYEQLTPLINGILANKTCIIGSIRSQVVHTKKYFEALHHPEVRAYFNDKERAYIDAHIPFTRALSKNDDLDTYVRDKDNYIIKPIDYYASKGVYAGKEFDADAWLKRLKECAEQGYIIQTFCPKSVTDNIHVSRDGQIEIEKFNHITGLFVYNEKLAGVFTRAGFNAVISDLNDGFSLSSLVADERG